MDFGLIFHIMVGFWLAMVIAATVAAIAGKLFE